MDKMTRIALALGMGAVLLAGCGWRTFLHTEEQNTTKVIKREPVVVPDDSSSQKTPVPRDSREIEVKRSVEERIIKRETVP